MRLTRVQVVAYTGLFVLLALFGSAIGYFYYFLGLDAFIFVALILIYRFYSFGRKSR